MKSGHKILSSEDEAKLPNIFDRNIFDENDFLDHTMKALLINGIYFGLCGMSEHQKLTINQYNAEESFPPGHLYFRCGKIEIDGLVDKSHR